MEIYQKLQISAAYNKKIEHKLHIKIDKLNITKQM